MNLKKILPDYPRTHHLCHNPNAQRTDLICSEKECAIIFDNEETYIEEKVDGASLGICYYEDNPIIRNRNNFLQKGKTGHLRTPAKLQFASIWNWFYENIHKFEKLNNLVGFEVALYGEWMVALHSCSYDKLPDYLIAYDLYDWEKDKFYNTGLARKYLTECGFTVPKLLHHGKINSWEQFDNWCKEKSEFSTTDLREGCYVKVCDKFHITDRFKIVRKDFIQGAMWSDRQLTKNKTVKNENL
jgi:hypothetical protein